MLHFVMRDASQLESLGEEDGISADMHTITITGVATHSLGPSGIHVGVWTRSNRHSDLQQLFSAASFGSSRKCSASYRRYFLLPEEKKLGCT